MKKNKFKKGDLAFNFDEKRGTIRSHVIIKQKMGIVTINPAINPFSKSKILSEFSQDFFLNKKELKREICKYIDKLKLKDATK